MQIRRIYEDTNVSQMIVPINEAVMFKSIKIRISGTAGASPPTIADVGRIGYWKRGRQLVDADAGYLQAINDIFGGAPEDTWAASSAGELWFSIPRRFGDKNVDHVVPSDKALLKCTFSDLSGIASAAKVEVYLDMEDGVQQYDLAINQFSDSLSASGTRPMSLDVDNILACLLSATVSSAITLTGSNLSEILTTIGGKSSDASLGALQSYTEEEFNLEDNFAKAAVLFASAGDITSRLYDGMKITVTSSGASVPEVAVISALFDDNRLKASISSQQARFNALMTKKADTNRVDDAASIRRITGK